MPQSSEPASGKTSEMASNLPETVAELHVNQGTGFHNVGMDTRRQERCNAIHDAAVHAVDIFTFKGNGPPPAVLSFRIQFQSGFASKQRRTLT
jgi:hypothetical protein